MSRALLLIAISNSVFLFTAERAAACPVCFGDPDSDMTKGAVWGIFVLGLIIYGMLTGMVGIGIAWFVRAKKLRG